MKSIKSNSLKVLFVIALLCPAAFADGDMGSGGFADPNEPVVKTTQSLEGDMGSGGRLANDTGRKRYLDSVLSSIYEYLDSVI
ncbi:MAG TPA: hypothetical protein VMZ26_05325 [Pyrinomonadaceae bacterium]|nr:hypothetical protein [Pyrinomonadaceae bacterium]